MQILWTESAWNFSAWEQRFKIEIQNINVESYFLSVAFVFLIFDVLKTSFTMGYCSAPYYNGSRS